MSGMDGTQIAEFSRSLVEPVTGDGACDRCGEPAQSKVTEGDDTVELCGLCTYKSVFAQTRGL